MSLEVKVENFQSFAKAEFEVKGFTVLTGANDLGKSALLRAVRYALDNQRGDYFIRNGTRKCRVRLKFDYPGHGLVGRDIEWEKARGASAVYLDYSNPLANGEPTRYEKVDAGITGVEPAIRFGEIEVGDAASVTPQIGMGYDPPFVVTATDDGIYKAFSSLFDLSLFQQLETSIRQEEASAKRTLLDSGRKLDVLQADLTKVNYPALETLVEEALSSLAVVNEVYGKQSDLVAVAAQVADIQAQASACRAAKKALTAVAGSCQTLAEAVTDVSDVSDLIAELTEALSQAAEFGKASGALADVVQALDVKSLSTVIDLASLRSVLTWQQMLAPAVTAVHEVVDSLSAVEDSRELLEVLASMEDLEKKRVKNAEDVVHARQRVESVRQRLDDLGVCPLCGNQTGTKGDSHAHQ